MLLQISKGVQRLDKSEAGPPDLASTQRHWSLTKLRSLVAWLILLCHENRLRIQLGLLHLFCGFQWPEGIWQKSRLCNSLWKYNSGSDNFMPCSKIQKSNCGLYIGLATDCTVHFDVRCPAPIVGRGYWLRIDRSQRADTLDSQLCCACLYNCMLQLQIQCLIYLSDDYLVHLFSR